MVRTPESNDKYMQALNFIITFLREHEQKLDELNSQLATVIEGIGDFDGVNEKLDNVNQGLVILEKKLKDLTAAVRKSSEP